MAILQLCVSQADNRAPFIFRLTNTKVFSLEEALFHSYYNWKQASDELFGPTFIDWVRKDLNFPDIAYKLRGYSGLRFSDRLTSYMRIIDYFDENEIKKLIKELEAWEKRVEWEKLKDRGDYFVMHGMPDKAISVYKTALGGGRRVSILNNMAVALMHMERYAESAAVLSEALEREPANTELRLNYAEACIYAGKTQEASHILEEMPPSESVYRILGEMYNRTGDTENALKNLTLAAKSYNEDHVYRLADYYIHAAEFDNAVSAINSVKRPNALAAIKRAEIYKAQNDLASASAVLENAVKAWPNDTELWLELSECSRLNSNTERAIQAASKALSLQPNNLRVKLEIVKVKRAQNNPREYQEVLRQLINSLKNEYRDMEEQAL